MILKNAVNFGIKVVGHMFGHNNFLEQGQNVLWSTHTNFGGHGPGLLWRPSFSFCGLFQTRNQPQYYWEQEIWGGKKKFGGN